MQVQKNPPFRISAIIGDKECTYFHKIPKSTAAA